MTLQELQSKIGQNSNSILGAMKLRQSGNQDVQNLYKYENPFMGDRFEQFDIQPKEPYYPIPQKESILDKIADVTPFMESQAAKSGKKVTLEQYAFTPEAKKTLTKDTEVVYPVKMDNAGEFEQFKNIDYIPGATSLRDRANEMGIKIPSSIDKLLNQYSGNKGKIKLQSRQTSTMAHELFHNYTQNKNFDAKSFNDAWEKEYTPEKKFVDDLLQFTPTYREMSEIGKAKERFAFMGQIRGVGGLNSIPANLKPFYKNILSPTLKTSKLATEAQTAKEQSDYLASPVGQAGLIAKEVLNNIKKYIKGR